LRVVEVRKEMKRRIQKRKGCMRTFKVVNNDREKFS
jgi:hypothetical protein